MPAFAEAHDLETVQIDSNGRLHELEPCTAKAWRSMREAAQQDGVTLLLLSAFRSIQRQREIVATKLATGFVLAEILRVNAYPGHSEHHSGQAIDLGSPHCAPLETAFETTPEFHWLVRHAAAFNFSLSYPKGNIAGVIYEPWHWRFEPRPDCLLDH